MSEITLRTIGYSGEDTLHVRFGFQCGGEFGMAFWHDNDGAWLIPWVEMDKLMAAYQKERPTVQEEAGP